MFATIGVIAGGDFTRFDYGYYLDIMAFSKEILMRYLCCQVAMQLHLKFLRGFLPGVPDLLQVDCNRNLSMPL